MAAALKPTPTYMNKWMYACDRNDDIHASLPIDPGRERTLVACPFSVTRKSKLRTVEALGKPREVERIVRKR